MDWFCGLLRVTLVSREKKREDLEGDKTKIAKKVKKKKKVLLLKADFFYSPGLSRAWTVDECLEELLFEFSPNQ